MYTTDRNGDDTTSTMCVALARRVTKANELSSTIRGAGAGVVPPVLTTPTDPALATAPTTTRQTNTRTATQTQCVAMPAPRRGYSCHGHVLTRPQAKGYRRRPHHDVRPYDRYDLCVDDDGTVAERLADDAQTTTATARSAHGATRLPPRPPRPPPSQPARSRSFRRTSTRCPRPTPQLLLPTLLPTLRTQAAPRLADRPAPTMLRRAVPPLRPGRLSSVLLSASQPSPSNEHETLDFPRLISRPLHDAPRPPMHGLYHRPRHGLSHVMTVTH